MARRDVARREGPGPLPAIVGGVLAVVVLSWVVGIVVGTVVMVVRIAVVVALLWAALRLWSIFSR